MKYNSNFILDYNAVKYHDLVLKCISDAQLENEDVTKVCCGASHDSCATSKTFPTGMIFIRLNTGPVRQYHKYVTPAAVQYGF